MMYDVGIFTRSDRNVWVLDILVSVSQVLGFVCRIIVVQQRELNQRIHFGSHTVKGPFTLSVSVRAALIIIAWIS